jgi:hypothetical protein
MITILWEWTRKSTLGSSVSFQQKSITLLYIKIIHYRNKMFPDSIMTACSVNIQHWRSITTTTFFDECCPKFVIFITYGKVCRWWFQNHLTRCSLISHHAFYLLYGFLYLNIQLDNLNPILFNNSFSFFSLSI